MKEKELKERLLEYVIYTSRVVEELKKVRRDPTPVNTVQAASTQRVLNMSDKELAEYRSRPMVTEAEYRAKPSKPLKENATQDEYYAWLTATRDDVTPDMVIRHEQMRRGSKNTLGESTKSAFSKDLREKAVEAFRFSKPTEILESQKERIVELNPIKELDKLPEQKPESLWVRLFNKLLGEMEKMPLPDPMSYAQKQEFFKKLDDEEKDGK